MVIKSSNKNYNKAKRVFMDILYSPVGAIVCVIVLVLVLALFGE